MASSPSPGCLLWPSMHEETPPLMRSSSLSHGEPGLEMTWSWPIKGSHWSSNKNKKIKLSCKVMLKKFLEDLFLPKIFSCHLSHLGATCGMEHMLFHPSSMLHWSWGISKAKDPSLRRVRVSFISCFHRHSCVFNTCLPLGLLLLV